MRGQKEQADGFCLNSGRIAGENAAAELDGFEYWYQGNPAWNRSEKMKITIDGKEIEAKEVLSPNT